MLTTIPIPASIMPSLVHNGHPLVEQDVPFFEEHLYP